MARPASAYASDPHFVRARPCLAPCGGEIVLYDLGEAVTLRWVVKHQPSGKSLETGSRETARTLYTQLAEGIDKRGFLPKATPVPVPAVSPPAPPPAKPPETGPKVPPRMEMTPRVRARPRDDSPTLLKTMEATSVGLAAVLDAHASDRWIVAQLIKQTRAVRTWESNGVMVTAPDGPTRMRALELLMERKYGKAFKAAEPRASKKMDVSSFMAKMKQSPEFRRTLREMVEQAEAEATQADVPTPETLTKPDETPAAGGPAPA